MSLSGAEMQAQLQAAGFAPSDTTNSQLPIFGTLRSKHPVPTPGNSNAAAGTASASGGATGGTSGGGTGGGATGGTGGGGGTSGNMGSGGAAGNVGMVTLADLQQMKNDIVGELRAEMRKEILKMKQELLDGILGPV